MMTEQEIPSPTVPKKNESSGVSSFFNKVAQTVFVARQKVMESLGQENGSVDPETQKKIDKLKMISGQYDQLSNLASTLSIHISALSESQKSIGDCLYEVGVKEEADTLSKTLQTAGRLNRELGKKSLEIVVSLQKLIDKITIFKQAVIADTLVTLERYTEARQQYDAGIKQLKALEATSNPELIAAAKAAVDISRQQVEKLSEDLGIKIVMLNEKRIQDLGKQLTDFMMTWKIYYTDCATLVQPGENNN